MTADYLDLGTIDYGPALEFQRDRAARRARGEVDDALLLLEHPHVITLGKKTSAPNLRPQQVPVFEVERGGDATYHGPGQLVGYPIILLEDHNVRRHVRTIELALIQTAARFGVEAETVEGHPGVWVGGKKLASIGVAVTNWVSYHGFAFNVNTDMSYFNLIRPCGLDPETMTSMEKMLGRRLAMETVKEAMVEEYSAAAGTKFDRTEITSPILPGNIK